MKVPGGFEIQYQLSVKQDEREPYFLWPSGLSGVLRVKWPKLYTRVEGEMGRRQTPSAADQLGETTRSTVREASYDFVSHVSVSKGENVGQIFNGRHAFSAGNCFPLQLLCFEQSDQYYLLSNSPASDYWLPAALRSGEYEIVGQDSVDGVVCTIVDRAGRDRLWIAEKHSNLVCRREFRSRQDGPVATRIESRDPRELAPGIWFPYEVRRQVLNKTGDKVIAELRLDVTSAVSGRVSDASLQVVFDGSEAQVDDLISGRIYHGSDENGDPFEEAVKRSFELRRSRPTDQIYFLIHLNAALLMAVGILAVSIRLARRKYTSTG